MKSYKVYLLGLASGVFLALSFPPMPFNLFAFVGLVPLLFMLEQPVKRKLLFTYLAFFIYHSGTNWWICSWQKDSDPYLMASGIALAFVHPFLFMIPIGIYRHLRKKQGLNAALWSLPFIWVSFEWLHSFSDIAYPWLTLGYAQIRDLAWVQFADLAGVWGVSFIIVFINTLIFRLIIIRQNENPGNFRKLLRIPAARNMFIILLITYTLPYIYGYFKLNEYQHEKISLNNPQIKISIIQPSINPWRKWETSPLKQIRQHTHIQDSLFEKTGKPDLAIWSETAITLFSLDFNAGHNFSFLQEWIDQNKTPLLTGFSDMYFYKPGEKALKTSKLFLGDSSRIYDSYNSSLLIHPSTDNMQPQIYHKMRLTPFGERIPFLEIITFARKWLEWGVGISSWAIGTEQKVLNLKKQDKAYKLGSVICIESIFPSFVANFVSLGADFLVIITNDAWYDYTVGPEQHYDIARMRAIESRRYIARCANTGVSGFITAAGKTLVRAEQYKATGFIGYVPALKEKSLYVITGDVLPVISVSVTIALLLLSFHGLRKKCTEKTKPHPNPLQAEREII